MARKIKISAKAKDSLVEIHNPTDWQANSSTFHPRTSVVRITSMAKSFSPPLHLPSRKDSHAKILITGKKSHEASIKSKTHLSTKNSAQQSIKDKTTKRTSIRPYQQPPIRSQLSLLLD
ncbi:hypothetical protein KSP40_PGU001657 [Platanthera guangdongensis]|uniref:Uncharacterized protein n=1 Tax=Platanthera guangdongensis TaxID=2320717 RepID=A0ABR2LTK6_9ASPA